ncbi:MAG: helix-turn-helix domain-containing protein [Phycisphaerales bacterium]|jgi:hypothetical protein
MIANAASIGKGLPAGQITITEARSLIIRNGLLRNVSCSAYRVMEHLLTHFYRLEPSSARPGFHRAINKHDESKGADRRSAWPSQARIAHDTGLSQSTVKRAVVELEEFGILVTTRTKRLTAHGIRARNRYGFLFPSRWFVAVRMEDGQMKTGAAQARPLTRQPRKPKAATEADTGSPPPPAHGVTHDPTHGVTHDPVKVKSKGKKTSVSVPVSTPDTPSAANAEPTPRQPDPEISSTANPPRAMDGATASPATHNADGALARADRPASKPAEDAFRGDGAAREANEPAASAEPPQARTARWRAPTEREVLARSLIAPEVLARIDAIQRRRDEAVGWTRGGEDEPATRKAVSRAARIARARSGNGN